MERPTIILKYCERCEKIAQYMDSNNLFMNLRLSNTLTVSGIKATFKRELYAKFDERGETVIPPKHSWVDKHMEELKDHNFIIEGKVADKRFIPLYLNYMEVMKYMRKHTPLEYEKWKEYYIYLTKEYLKEEKEEFYHWYKAQEIEEERIKTMWEIREPEILSYLKKKINETF